MARSASKILATTVTRIILLRDHGGLRFRTPRSLLILNAMGSAAAPLWRHKCNVYGVFSLLVGHAIFENVAAVAARFRRL